MNPQDRLRPSARVALLRIYLGESDHVGQRPAFEQVLECARRHGMAGATVFRGASGFGANSVIHHASPWRLSQDLPILIEIVDQEATIRNFLPGLHELLNGGGLVTLEQVEIVRYRGSEAPLSEGEAPA